MLRRDLLKSGTLFLAPTLRLAAPRRVVLVDLVGGASHIDTFDPKPNGPFGAIPTNAPGVELSGLLPRMAGVADRFTIIRSVYDTQPASHQRNPVADALRPIANIHRVEGWDTHGWGRFPALDVTRDSASRLDQLFPSLLDDDTFLVVASEFGRTPRLNPQGGRDHWNRCWSVVVSGPGVRPGRIIGATDATGSEPCDSPIHVEALAVKLLKMARAALNHSGGESL